VLGAHELYMLTMQLACTLLGACMRCCEVLEWPVCWTPLAPRADCQMVCMTHQVAVVCQACQQGVSKHNLWLQERVAS
jgi:hypothetical protein